MIRALGIPVAVATLAVSATPAQADTSKRRTIQGEDNPYLIITIELERSASWPRAGAPS